MLPLRYDRIIPVMYVYSLCFSIFKYEIGPVEHKFYIAYDNLLFKGVYQYNYQV